METFDDFMIHSRKLIHSSTAGSFALGNGYSMTTKPTAPEMLQWELKFSGYRWYVKDDGTIDLETKKSVNNFGWFMDFYRRHDLWDKFIYDDPVYGKKVVRFVSQIDEPEVLPGSEGVVEPFSVKLIEVSE